MTNEHNEYPQTGRFRKRPVVIHAHRFTDHLEADDWAQDLVERGIGRRLTDRPTGAIFSGDYRGIHIPTLEGVMIASPGDWIICGARGEFYPCKPDIFAATYDPSDA